MSTEQEPVPYEIYVGATNELFQLRALNAELLAALKDLQAWANMDASTNPTTIAVREKVKAAIVKTEGRE